MSKREHRYEFGAWTLITGDKPVVEVRLGIGYADGATHKRRNRHAHGHSPTI